MAQAGPKTLHSAKKHIAHHALDAALLIFFTMAAPGDVERAHSLAKDYHHKASKELWALLECVLCQPPPACPARPPR
jgi:hypothetical protein